MFSFQKNLLFRGAYMKKTQGQVCNLEEEPLFTHCNFSQHLCWRWEWKPWSVINIFSRRATLTNPWEKKRSMMCWWVSADEPSKGRKLLSYYRHNFSTVVLLTVFHLPFQTVCGNPAGRNIPVQLELHIWNNLQVRRFAGFRLHCSEHNKQAMGGLSSAQYIGSPKSKEDRFAEEWTEGDAPIRNNYKLPSIKYCKVGRWVFLHTGVV